MVSVFIIVIVIVIVITLGILVIVAMAVVIIVLVILAFSCFIFGNAAGRLLSRVGIVCFKRRASVSVTRVILLPRCSAYDL
jgi:hypothetical protein